MNMSRPDNPEVWQKLIREAGSMSRPDKHLARLIGEKDRLQNFSREDGGLFFDFSRQRLELSTLKLLLEMAEKRAVQNTFRAMTAGEIVNPTENRAALHTACREFSDTPVMMNGRDIMPDIRRVREEIRQFTRQLNAGEIVGATGRPFTDLVIIGIGGSYLGTEFVARALQANVRPERRLHFLSNVDIHNFGDITAAIDPETTLWIVVSKSFTTAETMANANLARTFMENKGLDPVRHFLAITSQGSPGDPETGKSTFPVLRAFHMFDFIGGRYSVSSAVGGVPLSLYLGYEQFERFLQGAGQMDRHAREAPAEKNLPLLAALIGIWNNNFLGYPAQAIIPYASPLAKLAPHIQQLYMESNGKAVTVGGEPAKESTGVLIFGEPGTNAQHSFFQLAHQGSGFPIDFIGVIRPQYEEDPILSRGVTNHQELWANLISQPKALAEGKNDANPHKQFPGNRPSSTLILPDLSPESVGKLLAFYEARTVYEAFIWGINPFDQFGVELGKTLAGQIRDRLAAYNEDPAKKPVSEDPIADFYLNLITR